MFLSQGNQQYLFEIVEPHYKIHHDSTATNHNLYNNRITSVE